MNTINQSKQKIEKCNQTLRKGLSVRTNLRAGIAWDDIDDQAISLWNKLKGAVSNATQTVSDTVKSATA